MFIRIAIIFIFFLALNANAQPGIDSIQVKQRINYITDKGSEVYLVWAMDNWKTPEDKYWAEGTYNNNGMAYSPMTGTKDSFSIDLNLPKGIYIDFMIWVSKDKNGNPSESWDNNWGSNYNLYIDGKNKIQNINDEKLYMVEKKEKPFNILEKGWVILVTGVCILLFVLLIRIYNRKKVSISRYSGSSLISGLILSVTLLMLFIRLQMNGILSQNQYLVFGVGYYDLAFMVVFSFFIVLLLYLVRKNKILRVCLQSLFILLLLVVSLASILNIEVVRQIGKPLTYNWLYYSDFLKANDAKNAVKAGLSPTLVRNIAFIISGLIIVAAGFSLIHQLVIKKSRRFLLIISLVFLTVLAASFVQFKSNKFETGKIENPVSTLLFSWINVSREPSLFAMKVSSEVKETIEKMHTAREYEKNPFSDSITNVVVFIFESTPANLVQVYDSTYKATSNLNTWKQHALIFENMYAHLPTTANTMLSIISGIYPMISYKSIVNEYPAIKIPSLPATLKDNGWATSLFFSSDLTYSNMGPYLKYQQIETVEDFKNISCNYKKFNSSYSQLDGLDDRCIVNHYFDWKANNTSKKNFSILWTNQTHYPYFYSGDEKYYSDNKELNKFLNALEEVDYAFGELMIGLQKRNELNNTLVIVIGDHGEAFGTHGQYTHASNIYEENLKVPFLIINPKMFHGEIDSRIAGMIDVAPTVTHLLGLQQPVEWQGSDLLSINKRSHTFFIGPYSDFQFGSRFQNWKLIFNASKNEYKLLDLKTDPGELNDVSDKHQKMVKKEFELLAGWVQYHNKKIEILKSNK